MAVRLTMFLWRNSQGHDHDVPYTRLSIALRASKCFQVGKPALVVTASHEGNLNAVLVWCYACEKVVVQPGSRSFICCLDKAFKETFLPYVIDADNALS